MSPVIPAFCQTIRKLTLGFDFRGCPSPFPLPECRSSAEDMTPDGGRVRPAERRGHRVGGSANAPSHRSRAKPSAAPLTGPAERGGVLRSSASHQALQIAQMRSLSKPLLAPSPRSFSWKTPERAMANRANEIALEAANRSVTGDRSQRRRPNELWQIAPMRSLTKPLLAPSPLRSTIHDPRSAMLFVSSP